MRWLVFVERKKHGSLLIQNRSILNHSAMLALAAIVHSKNMHLDNSTSTREDIEDEINMLDPDDKRSIPKKKQQVMESGPQMNKSLKRKRFVYYTKKLPRFLRNQPNGNLFRAKTLGMEIRELTHNEYNDLFGSESGGRSEPPPGLAPPDPGNSLWVSTLCSCKDNLGVETHCVLTVFAPFSRRYHKVGPVE